MHDIWIIAENASWAAELISAAKSVKADAQVTAFVKGDVAEAQLALACGATSAFALPLPADGMWEDYAPALTEKAKADKPSLILVSSSKRGRDLAARSAALLDAPCFSDGKSFSLDGNVFTCGTSIYGGAAVKVESTTAPVIFVTVGPKAYDPAPTDSSRSGQVATLAYTAGNAKVTERRARPQQTVNLGDAAKVVSVGRGFSERNDLDAAKELAGVLGAEMSCSRPIAEFFKWMPEECYIGISGQIIKPQLYLAVGISGQAQHLFGVRDAKIIVSVNKDAECLMSQNADYYIVGEWQAVIPALLKELKA